MNIPNQQRWRSFCRGRSLARHFRLKPILTSSSINVAIARLSFVQDCLSSSTAFGRFPSSLILSMQRDISLQPQYGFQAFDSAIVWQLIKPYTPITGDTS